MLAASFCGAAAASRTHSGDAGKTLVSDLNGAQLGKKEPHSRPRWTHLCHRHVEGVATDVAVAAVAVGVAAETFDVIIELCPTGAAAWHISLNFLIKLFFTLLPLFLLRATKITHECEKRNRMELFFFLPFTHVAAQQHSSRGSGSGSSGS